MNRLDVAVQHDLSDAPEAPPVADIERRAQRRRTRELAVGCGAVVALVAIAVGGFVWTRPIAPVEVRTTSQPIASTSTTVPWGPIPPGPPLATAATLPGLRGVVQTVHHYAEGDGPVETAEIVATTTDKASVLFGGQRGSRPVYLVRLTGQFVCNDCSVPPGAKAPHGDEIVFMVPRHAPPPPDSAFSLGSRNVDLSAFGRVYRLPIATARLELPSHTLRSGASMRGTVVVQNDTGNPLHVVGCKNFYAAVLGNAQHPPQVAWLQCRETFTVPVGVSRYGVVVDASPMLCRTIELCKLAPGNYRADVMASDKAVPLAPSVPVRVTP